MKKTKKQRRREKWWKTRERRAKIIYIEKNLFERYPGYFYFLDKDLREVSRLYLTIAHYSRWGGPFADPSLDDISELKEFEGRKYRVFNLDPFSDDGLEFLFKENLIFTFNNPTVDLYCLLPCLENKMNLSRYVDNDNRVDLEKMISDYFGDLDFMQTLDDCWNGWGYYHVYGGKK